MQLLAVRFVNMVKCMCALDSYIYIYTYALKSIQSLFRSVVSFGYATADTGVQQCGLSMHSGIMQPCLGHALAHALSQAMPWC